MWGCGAYSQQTAIFRRKRAPHHRGASVGDVRQKGEKANATIKGAGCLRRIAEGVQSNNKRFVSMQKNIQNCYSCCALDVITGKMINCPEEMKNKVGQESRLAVCSQCIQKWLNEEE